MEKKDIVTRAANMHTKSDLLLLLNALLKDEMGDPCKFKFSIRQLEFNSNPKNDKRYRHFSISKKSGGERMISAPTRGLRHILQYVNIIFKSLYTPSEYAMGYCVGRNVVDNAVRHIGQNYIFNTDLEDLFPSIHQFRVQRRLEAAPFNFSDSVSRVLAGLCCMRKEKPNGGYEYVLPQGAPTSPILANAVCDDLDRKLAGLSRRFGLHYTRYADDITFSSMHNVYQQDGEFLMEFEKIVKGQGFKINKEKTRLQKVGQHQEVTGLTVSSRVNTTRKYVAEIRNILHIWERYGFDDAYASFYKHYVRSKGYIKKRIPLLENVLFGKLQYLKMVKGEKDPVYSALQTRYNNLASPINIARKKLDYLYSFSKEEFEEKIGCGIKYRLSAKGEIYGEFDVGDTPTRVTISRPVKTQLISSGNPMDLYVVLASKDGKEPFWMLTYGDPLDGQRRDRELVSKLLGVWQNNGEKATISKYEKISKQMSRQGFGNSLLLNNRGLSANDKLLLQGLLRSEMKADGEEVERSKLFQYTDTELFPKVGGEDAGKPRSERKHVHRPKDTAAFLALFNDDSNRGFKYLTHKPAEEKEYGDYLDAVVKTFFEKSNEYKIPETLFSMMRAALTGQEKWTAGNGKMQEYNYDLWKNQVKNNPEMKKLKEADFNTMTNLFRETIRIQNPRLEEIVKDIEMDLKVQIPGFNLKISRNELDDADFYTYVYWLREGIKKILEDIYLREHDAHVEISYKCIDKKRDEYGTRIISITHCGSIGRAHRQGKRKILGDTSGAFKEMRTCFFGYCNWSVETMWKDYGPSRINILDDNPKQKSEKKLKEAPKGFTHILTYYYKNK